MRYLDEPELTQLGLHPQDLPRSPRQQIGRVVRGTGARVLAELLE